MDVSVEMKCQRCPSWGQVGGTFLFFILIPALVYTVWRNYHFYAPRFLSYSWLMLIEPDFVYCYCITGIQALFAGFVFVFFIRQQKYLLSSIGAILLHLMILLISYFGIVFSYRPEFNSLYILYSKSSVAIANSMSSALVKQFYAAEFLVFSLTSLGLTVLASAVLALHIREKCKQGVIYNEATWRQKSKPKTV